MSNIDEKEQILDLIALRPNIRSVEISDQLDIDMERIRPLIQREIDDGQIVIGSIKAPNGLMVDVFRSTATEPVVQRKPTHAVAHIAPVTKVDKAIAYLRENGPVPTDFLARAMGLKKGDHPSQFLASAINDGRIIRDNKEWRIGTAGSPALPAAQMPPAKEIPVVIPTFIPVPKVPELAPTAVLVTREPEPVVMPADAVDSAAHVDPAAVTQFVAGLLSNGELRLDVGGNVTTLCQEHAMALHAYLTKVAPALLQA